jgi:hypothetical protein
MYLFNSVPKVSNIFNRVILSMSFSGQMWLIYEIQCRFNKFDEKTVGMDEMTQLRNVQKICDHEFKINFILGLYFDLILRYKHIEITLINLS